MTPRQRARMAEVVASCVSEARARQAARRAPRAVTLAERVAAIRRAMILRKAVA